MSAQINNTFTSAVRTVNLPPLKSKEKLVFYKSFAKVRASTNQLSQKEAEIWCVLEMGKLKSMNYSQMDPLVILQEFFPSKNHNYAMIYSIYMTLVTAWSIHQAM